MSNTTKSKRHTNKRQNQIRALLRKKNLATVAEIAETLDISEPYTTTLIGILIKKRDVFLSHTEPSPKGGRSRNVYALTPAYYEKLEYASNYWKERHGATQEQPAVEAQPPKFEPTFAPIKRTQERTPWYRRILGLFSSNESRASV